jgi:hypothetical protein
MGCACPTDSKPVADTTGEDQVAVYESCLPFAKQPATKTATEALVFAHAGYLTGKQLKDLLKSLGMEIGDLDEENRPKNCLFQMFKEGKKYNSRKITLLGVMLGSGTLVRKAEILFNLYRNEDEREISASQIQRMVQHCCEVALYTLPHYAQMELEAVEEAKSLPKLLKYVQRLSSSLPATVETLSAALLGSADHLTEVVFKHKLASTEGRFLCSTVDLRVFASSMKPIKRPVRAKSPDEDPEELRREASDQVRELLTSPEGKKVVRIRYKLRRSSSSPLRVSESEEQFNEN